MLFIDFATVGAESPLDLPAAIHPTTVHRGVDDIVKNRESFFHLHMISDSTGETLINVARAAAAQYSDSRAIEHLHSMVRTTKRLDRIITELEEENR